MVPMIQIPVTHGSKSHGGSAPLHRGHERSYLSGNKGTNFIGNMLLGRRRQFEYEYAEAVLDIFGHEMDWTDD